MEDNKIIITEHKKSLIQLCIIFFLLTIFLCYILFFHTTSDEDRIFYGVFLSIGVISIIITLVHLTNKKPKAILSVEGFWHKDLNEVIRWDDISSYYYEITINEGINFCVIVFGIKSKKRKVGLDLTLIGLSIDELNELINKFRGENRIIYKGVIEK